MNSFNFAMLPACSSWPACNRHIVLAGINFLHTRRKHLHVLLILVSYQRKDLYACVQSVLIYGTETWAMKADDLRSLERTEHMMVRWMCGCP